MPTSGPISSTSSRLRHPDQPDGQLTLVGRLALDRQADPVDQLRQLGRSRPGLHGEDEHSGRRGMIGVGLELLAVSGHERVGPLDDRHPAFGQER
jgi:hypothetical protein